MPDEQKNASPLSGVVPPKVHRFNSANAAEYARRSHKVRREKGRIREALLKELEKVYTTPDGEQVDGYTLMAKAAIARMIKNPKYWEIVRDTTGEKPKDNVALSHAFMGDFEIVLGDEDAD